MWATVGLLWYYVGWDVFKHAGERGHLQNKIRRNFAGNVVQVPHDNPVSYPIGSFVLSRRRAWLSILNIHLALPGRSHGTDTRIPSCSKLWFSPCLGQLCVVIVFSAYTMVVSCFYDLVLKNASYKVAERWEGVGLLWCVVRCDVLKPAAEEAHQQVRIRRTVRRPSC